MYAGSEEFPAAAKIGMPRPMTALIAVLMMNIWLPYQFVARDMFATAGVPMFAGFAIQLRPATTLATEPEFCGPRTRSEVIDAPRATPEIEPAAIEADQAGRC